MSPYVVAVSPSDLRVEQREVPPPAAGRVLVAVRAAGMNPYDLQRIGGASEASPVRPGGEVAGVVAAVGDGVDGVAVGDEVVAQPVIGGWAGVVVAKAEHVFARPAPLTFPQAANLLVAGTAAAHAVAAAGIGPGGTVLVHGASGGVGQQVVQLARLRGATTVIGTCGAASDGLVERLGAVPVRYGPGLLDRVRALAPRGVTAAVDCAGTAEAREASMALVDDPAHAVTLADFSGAFAAADGRVLGSGPGADPGAALRAAARGELIRLADEGSLQVAVARTFPLEDVEAAVQLLASRHAGGKLALVP